jgi:hypothetical protein
VTRLSRVLPSIGLLASGCDLLGPEDPFTGACDELATMPTPVAAGTTAASAPEVATHTLYQVSLPEGMSGRAGLVKFASNLRGRLLLFLTEDLPVTVSHTGGDLPASASGKSGPCDELKAWSQYTVGVGPQLISLGGSGNVRTSVGLVLETQADAL